MAPACGSLFRIAVQFWAIFISSSVYSGCHGVTFPYESINEIKLEYELPSLPFDYVDLEPYIDIVTVRLHYFGHHQGYTRKLNAVLQQWKSEDPETFVSSSVLGLLEHLDDVPEKYRRGIKNNGGGYVNHNLYWSVMSANKDNETSEPTGALLEEINQSFGSFEAFKKEFTDKALDLFGSGYVWMSQHEHSLVSQDEEDMPKLVLTTTANQDSPISEGLQPVLILDVWEHAYYLKHQYRRANHIADWWKVVDWTAVAELSHWWTTKDEVHDEL